jgi:hypothetical protein
MESCFSDIMLMSAKSLYQLDLVLLISNRTESRK